MPQKSYAPYLLLFPALALAGFVLLFPLAQVITMAASDVSRFGKITGWNTLANFSKVFADPSFWTALWNTFIWTGTVVAGTVAVSIPVAIILNQPFAGRSIARVLVMLPWSVSLSMSAIVWLWALDGEIGYVNKLLSDIGLPWGHVQWLSQPGPAFVAVIFVGIFVSIPFTVTVLLGGLSSIPDDVYEAAALEGANGVQRFMRITLPLLRPFLNLVLVLNVINVFNSFPIIWVMTAGGPSDQTHILVTYLYQLAFRLGRLGEASAISIIMLALLVVFTAIYLRLIPKEPQHA
ncbi:ABC transporter permease subunit [Agrobacterium vitis]|uniref:carbohydrate ABC transporter permease n=1 Tax=Rhizobium/Agrobacterium group TaxID=227290 RepID=UPI0012E9871B|nr:MULTISPECIES: sugar ABC transporter permease [Rhizobium/Agrobacterium group]MCF1494367.1 sugar ABC transporter permease [Allorhizobium ampelinum]MVA45873.1 ABC transporter permease subunit [Agrobacterium vitis]